MKFITKIELFGLNERLIDEARLKVINKNKLIIGFACIGTVDVHTDEDCDIHLQGEKYRYS